MATAHPVNRQGQTNLSTRPSIGRTRTDPIPVARSQRVLDIRNLTSFMPGKAAPVCAFPLLREDRLAMSRFRINIEQMETAELLMNAVTVRAMAYLVPNLAFDRFDGIDQLNRSYKKELNAGASQVIPYFTTLTEGAHGSNAIHKCLGKHARPGTQVNGAYVEAYNTIYNFRAKNRSPDLEMRTLVDTTLAPAFWNHQGFAHIVPDFDQAVIDGEVPLTVVNSHLPVKGFGYNTQTPPAGPVGFQESGGGAAANYPYGFIIRGSAEAATAGTSKMAYKATGSAGGIDVWAELEENGITVSLANIEVARKTQAFAALRKQYGGHSDDYIIDLLMSGITVPEQAWRQPILLADQTSVVGMAKRYASDSEDLTASVTNGAAFIDLALTTPTVPTGGIVMIIVEVTPEQLFERQQDPYLFVTDQDLLPEFLRDTLDPEKVEVVQNQYVDLDHASPTGTFGYAPLNHQWAHIGPGIGGKFFRPEVDAPTDEDRQRIWAVETANPTLSKDFYLCTNIHTKPFVVTNQDPYECVTRGLVQISGNTVFGNILVEASDDYEKVLEEAPLDRIEKP